jgi:hypothetical protein
VTDSRSRRKGSARGRPFDPHLSRHASATLSGVRRHYDKNRANLLALSAASPRVALFELIVFVRCVVNLK